MNLPEQQGKLRVPEIDLQKILAEMERARTAGASTSVTVHFAPNGGVLAITRQSEWKIK